MKTKEILARQNIINEHEKRIDEILEKEVNDLSISELSFIKGVSSGSITTMKKNGASNEKILRTKQHSAMSDAEKTLLYLQSLSDTQLATFLDQLK